MNEKDFEFLKNNNQEVLLILQKLIVNMHKLMDNLEDFKKTTQSQIINLEIDMADVQRKVKSLL